MPNGACISHSIYSMDTFTTFDLSNACLHSFRCHIEITHC